MADENMRCKKRACIVENPTGPTAAVSIDKNVCVGCNHCAGVCRTQTIMKNPVPGEPPVLVYPDECWYCACCVEACPTGALKMNLPINQRILFKRKENNEVYRIGQSSGPDKSYFGMPYGWRDDDQSVGAKEQASDEQKTEQEEELVSLLAEFRDQPDRLMPALQKVQEHYGYVDVDKQEQIAAVLGITLTEVASVASFYTFYHHEQHGKYVLRLCDSAVCHTKGAAETLQTFKDILGIQEDETTADGLFTLKTCTCLGACDRAPAVLVNNELYGPVNPKDVLKFLEQLREEAQK